MHNPELDSQRPWRSQNRLALRSLRIVYRRQEQRSCRSSPMKLLWALGLQRPNPRANQILESYADRIGYSEKTVVYVKVA